MSRADGILVVSLTHKWFDMIASGEKLEEYRGVNWADKLMSAKFFFYATLPYPTTFTGREASSCASVPVELDVRRWQINAGEQNAVDKNQ